MVYLDSKMTLLAWCRLREAFRMFRVDRIREVRLAGTGFRPRRVALLRSYLAELRTGRSFAVAAGSAPTEPT